ncbi:hypothetical protein ACTZWW_04255 [Salinarimonas sp. NSM]|uniref:hypothetical protein n=1 Tax=Salinarimonas sp. NSM TaxID=3458003 RepID=UPI0040359C5B
MTFAPLSTGEPSRVGRLRAYGNAICVPVAALFLESILAERAVKAALAPTMEAAE